MEIAQHKNVDVYEWSQINDNTILMMSEKTNDKFIL